MSSSSNTPFPFLRLPPELRAEVYSHLHYFRYPLIIPKAVQDKAGDITGRWTVNAAPISLLKTSRIIKSEVEDGLCRVNLHCTPVLVGQSADAPFFNVLLRFFRSANGQGQIRLRDTGSGLQRSIDEIDVAYLDKAAEGLALELDRHCTRHRREEPCIEPRHVRSFTKWTLLRLRYTSSIRVLFPVNVNISRPWSVLSGGSVDLWRSAALLRNAERANLSIVSHVTILTAGHIERAVLEDQLGPWKTRLDELGVAWEVASNDDNLKWHFPAIFSRSPATNHDEEPSGNTTAHK